MANIFKDLDSLNLVLEGTVSNYRNIREDKEFKAECDITEAHYSPSKQQEMQAPKRQEQPRREEYDTKEYQEMRRESPPAEYYQQKRESPAAEPFEQNQEMPPTGMYQERREGQEEEMIQPMGEAPEEFQPREDMPPAQMYQARKEPIPTGQYQPKRESPVAVGYQKREYAVAGGYQGKRELPATATYQSKKETGYAVGFQKKEHAPVASYQTRSQYVGTYQPKKEYAPAVGYQPRMEAPEEGQSQPQPVSQQPPSVSYGFKRHEAEVTAQKTKSGYYGQAKPQTEEPGKYKQAYTSSTTYKTRTEEQGPTTGHTYAYQSKTKEVSPAQVTSYKTATTTAKYALPSKEYGAKYGH